ncbi:Protein of unknown function (DUF1800) [Seminavis robusta]|uniref:DUF1501 domain-containing protein n=1 Tax=Seminavis robusta TaxID=568900 RepID=A0A9N8E714_9STRA|nr:Protein of unknown function (DUF1800) [Seminavis robusta]|eukprot:Sro612_g175460.1 Protein of unknown function (DUF1800) (1242) ;mRNA; r:26168-30324
MMAHMLAYEGGRSTAAVWSREGTLAFADENYAREVMQLFTTGLFQLSTNGTMIHDDNGEPVRVYSNDDIEEYARAWTGFHAQKLRGNIEPQTNNRIDPMRINNLLRDRLPKMGVSRKYIGDGYPLCSDLPTRHFLVRGATYRLLGSSSKAELHNDPPMLHPSAVQFILEPESHLYEKLCNAGAGSMCNYLSVVVLNETVACLGRECSVDAIRSVSVGGVFYEYVRPPCVHHAFYNDGKAIVPRWQRNRIQCSDPRLEAALACCLNEGTNSSSSHYSEEFNAERTRFSTAQTRCQLGLCRRGEQAPRQPCDHTDKTKCWDRSHFWTDQPCSLQAKIIRDSGKVGIVHVPPAEVGSNNTAFIVREDTKTFFRVDWEGDIQAILSNCTNIPSCREAEDNSCLCDVSVVQGNVFSGASIPNHQEILANLDVGSFIPDDWSGTSHDDVTAYNLGSDGSLMADSAFEVVDDSGRKHVRKNMKSSVVIVGTDVSFRNPVHFSSLADPDPRDAHYETDATLDHYFYHPNTAPFLSTRFAQRFSISNPSPRYVEKIATAFRSGHFNFTEGGRTTTFGSGGYGDLRATFAAILLDREARNVLLDNDPTHGALKEPLIKLIGLMRSLEFQLNDPYTWVQFDRRLREKIGQMAHDITSVFSFFLPDYQPPGPVALGSLRSPEARVLTGPSVISALNGLFSLIKYGLSDCVGGHGLEGVIDCDKVAIGMTNISTGGLNYLPESQSESSDSSEEVIDELAMLMTSGRLSHETRELIRRAYDENQEDNALLKAQLLTVAAPEFHVTNTIKRKDTTRERPSTGTAQPKPYKALVYIVLDGGMDAYNLLAPHSCTPVNSQGFNLLEQYNLERRDLALSDGERTRIIDAENQPCDQFAIHPEMPFVERLYNEGELSFFANVGQLDAEATTGNYHEVTRSELFAHDKMKLELNRIDPWDQQLNTGILGRICDSLLAKNDTCQAITIQDATVATVGGIPGTSRTPLIVSVDGLDAFAPVHEGETFDVKDYVAQLNKATSLHSSVFGETWSRTLEQAIAEAEQLPTALSNVTLTQSYPNDPIEYTGKSQMLSKLILTQKARGSDRDVIFLNLGSWDHHRSMKVGLAKELRGLDQALSLFEAEMKAQGLWSDVTVAVTSEFGRTLTSNSNAGSDHGWGGHAFVFGGSVRGGKIHGEYPSDIQLGGHVNIGRGRLIPTSSWESMLTSAVQWMGVQDEADLDYCMPNRHGSGATPFLFDDVYIAH